MPRLQNRAFFAGMQEAVQAVLDPASRKISPGRRREWEKLRTRLLGHGAPERPQPTTVADLLTDFTP
ncbi:hypothetical protein JOF53_008146 [Crossiella equi]|uniref:Uncharacterized protein n=1 Tax=Crossiella equi TaxID=130796 RepID=A0ABS5ASV2_9PSEU|nr:hypothetical protein [Crossiella equi]MBP2479274.1 hypothetical protein [Crossiella equi]